MSRHRDIRSMNYSDEYDGYDDIYGHSVEDDYCLSPSAEQFLYDRNKQPNIASFINEPNIEEGDEEEKMDLTSPKNLQLSELDRVKIISAIEIIRNVIGDTIPDTVLTEKIVEFDFDAAAALDDILKSTSPESQTELNVSQEDREKQESGCSSERHTDSNLRSSQNLLDKKSTSLIFGSENYKLESNAGFSSVTSLKTNHKANVTTPVNTTEKRKFDSLVELMNYHTNNVSPLKEKTIFNSENMKSDKKLFDSLTSMTAHHLQKSNNSLKQPTVSKIPFVIPKLSPKSSINFPITFETKSESKIVKKISAKMSLTELSEISETSREPIKTHRMTVNDEDCMIDLTMALRPSGTLPTIINKNLKLISNKHLSENSIAKSANNFHDIKEIYQYTREPIPLLLGVNEIHKLECNFNLIKLHYLKLKHNTMVSRFGKMICKKWKIPKPKFKKTIFESKFISNIERFNFSSPSPDNIILSNLRRM
ncbi:hypothetical protein PV325_007318 [Microctonus aethiopoides]|nr:hypothetical protein PV325_007318 [Microctonus aethiopoides]